MVGHVEAIGPMLFGHVFGFVSQSVPPEAPRFQAGCGELCWAHFGGSNARIKATFWAKIGAKLGHLGHPFGIWKLRGAKWGILRASWAIGRSS